MSTVYDTYANQLLSLDRGRALWHPGPDNRPPVEIGDVGFIKRGRFCRLFNIHLPTDHPSQPNVLPEGFRPLELNQRQIYTDRLKRGVYCSQNVRAAEIRASALAG